MNITTDAGKRLAARLEQTEREQLAAIAAGVGHLYGREPEAAPPVGNPANNRFFGVAPGKSADSPRSGTGRFFGPTAG